MQILHCVFGQMLIAAGCPYRIVHGHLAVAIDQQVALT
jgi:hypothetical protein